MFESLQASAQQAQARSDFQSAARFYSQAAKLRPELAELKANLGLMYYQTGRNEEAAEVFLQALRLKPELFVPNLFLGLDYVRLKQFKKAIPYLKHAALSKPADIQTQFGLGQAYAGSGDSRLAIPYYLRATEFDSGNADAWCRLGMSYLEQVEADAQILLTHYKDSAYLQVLMADNFSEQGAFIQASEAYRKALTSSAPPAGAHASYASVLLRQHDFPAAERELNAELVSDPGSLMAKLGMARLHVEQATTEQAAKEIGQIWETDAGFLKTHASRFSAALPQPKLSELQRVLKDDQAAGTLSPQVVALFRSDSTIDEGSVSDVDATRSNRSANRPPTELYASGQYRQCADRLASTLPLLQAGDLRLLVWCAYATGDYPSAFHAAARLVSSAATEAEGLYWETQSAQKLATEALRRASSLDTDSSSLHVLLGDVSRQRKYFPDAEQEYRKALTLQPEDSGALFGLSLALFADDQAAEAFRVAQAALKKRPDDPEFNAVTGEILCARNDFDGAEPYLKKALRTKPEYVPHVHALLGKVYARTGRTEQAIAEFKLALADDKDGTVHYQIARLYLKVGDRDSAKQAFDVSRRIRSDGLNRAAVAMQQGEDDSESQ